MERYIAIDGVCAWPNMTQLSNGDLVVGIFNQPVHGRWEGDVEAWASEDGGYRWTKRGIATPGEPPGNRMNVAAGCAGDGDLIVISSGWTPVLAPGVEDPEFEFRKREVLAPRVCRSSDGGRTWAREDSVDLPAGERWFIPFGDVVAAHPLLGVSFYSSSPDGTKNTSWFVRSIDDGRTWGDASVIGANDYNETDLLSLGDSRWLAVCRTLTDGHLQLFGSDDDGRTWTGQGPVSLPRQHPGHLTRLADGRLLLSYGLRNDGLHGVAVRISADDGQTWLAPRVLVDLDLPVDCGYPSSAQIADGTIVTAYYAKQVTAHMRYHMGVVRWDPPATGPMIG
jgi:hypothetical protein